MATKAKKKVGLYINTTENKSTNLPFQADDAFGIFGQHATPFILAAFNCKLREVV